MSGCQHYFSTIKLTDVTQRKINGIVGHLETKARVVEVTKRYIFV